MAFLSPVLHKTGKCGSQASCDSSRMKQAGPIFKLIIEEGRCDDPSAIMLGVGGASDDELATFLHQFLVKKVVCHLTIS